MRRGPHTHPCSRCHVETECCGDLEQNYDGEPPVICVEYHTHNRVDFLCEACAALMDRCEDDVTGVPV